MYLFILFNINDLLLVNNLKNMNNMPTLPDFPQTTRWELEYTFNNSISEESRNMIDRWEKQNVDSLKINKVIVALSMQYTQEWFVNIQFLESELSRLSNEWIKTVLIAWTTWEATHLSKYEHITYVRLACKIAKKYWINIIAWAWSNNTNEQSKLIDWTLWWNFAVDETITNQFFNITKDIDILKSPWAVATLLLSPYYIKTDNANLIKHFVDWLNRWPAIIYSIKARTWMEIPLDVLEILSKHPNFIWVKECDWPDRVKYLVNNWITVWTWNDDTITQDVNELWWYWVISVTSNIVSDSVLEIVQYWWSSIGDINRNKIASELLFPWIPNPIMIHNVTSLQRNYWEIPAIFRWPTWPISKEQQEWALKYMQVLWLNWKIFWNNYKIFV